MATELDNLIEWLLDRIASSGEDGVSISQILALVVAFYNEPDALDRQKANLEDGGTPGIDREFKSKVWRLLTAHADISVGKDKCGNHLDLSEIEAIPPSAPEEPGKPPDTPSLTNGLNRVFHGGMSEHGMTTSGEGISKGCLPAFEEEDTEDPSSPSAQLLEQNQHPDSQALFANTEVSNPLLENVEQRIADVLESRSQSDEAEPEVPFKNVGKSGSSMPEVGKGAEELVIQGQLSTETGEIVHRNGPDDFDENSVTTTLKTQPRVYFARVGQQMDVNGHRINSKQPPKLESSSNPPKRRGRPPKIKNRESLSRRGRPPKAGLLTSLPSASIPQQKTPTETLGSTNALPIETISEIKRSRGRLPQNYTLFTSHDELQRAAGLPGVYFDLEEFENSGIGRPKKKMIALFKSEKLKSLHWMRGIAKEIEVATTFDQTINPVEPTLIESSNESLIQENGALSNKRNHQSEDSIRDEPQPKRRLLDIVRQVGKLNSISYRSPYTSTSATFQTPISTDIATVSRSLSKDGEILSLGTEHHSIVTPADLTVIESPNRFSALKNAVDEIPPTQAPEFMGNEQLVADINPAANLTIANVAFQLPCSKDGAIGNLCLSVDKKSLSFIVEDVQEEISPPSIQISDIVEPPETSPAGSEIMVLRIITSNTNSGEDTNEFRFLPTQTAFLTANSMRAKIVTAMMLLDLEDDNNLVPQDKPFKCSGCDGAWKNLEGLKYHQTKSKTSCNPNHIQRARRRSRSDVEYKSSSKDQRVLTESEHNIAPEDFVHERPAGPKYSVQDVKTKLTRSDPELQKAKDIIMALLDANSQIFPGEKSLWFAVVASSLQKFPNSGLSNYDICIDALDLLEDNGFVRRLQFSFRDNRGLMKMRTIITGKNVDPTSTAVVAMKENIRSKFPEHFIPVGFEPPKVVQSMLEERHNRVEAIKSSHLSHQPPAVPQKQDSGSGKELEALRTSLNPSQSCSITRSGRVSRRPKSLLESTLTSSTLTIAEITEYDSYSEEFLSPGLISERRNTLSDGWKKGKRSKPRSSLKGSAFTQGSPLLHGLNDTQSPQMIEVEFLEESDSEIPQRKRRKYETFTADVVSDRAAMWHPASTYLQNGNGSWNIATQPRVTRKYRPRAGLPEPITYLQTLHNSAWKFRPYGHGVRPIHARPAKRTEGQTAYLTRIRNGFRPVMMPTGEIFIPDVIPESPAEAPTPTRLIRQKRKYTRESTTVPAMQETGTESFQQSLGSVVKKRKYSRRTSNISNSHAETLAPHIEGPRAVLSEYSALISVPRTPLLNEREYGHIGGFEGRSALFDHTPSVPLSYHLPNSKNNARGSERPAGSSLLFPAQNSGLYGGSIASAQGFPRTTVRFLAANTELGWESENLDLVLTSSESRQLSISIDSRCTSVEPCEEITTFVNESEQLHSIKWQSPEVLRDHNGRWPVKDDKNFDSGSFTMEGWFPSTADFLRQLLPADVGEVVAAMRSRKVISEDYPNPEWAAFLRDVETVERWEQGKAMDLLQTGTVAPNYIFMHHTLDTLESASSGLIQTRWLDQNSYTLKTFPYQELEECDNAQRHEELYPMKDQNQHTRELQACETSHKVPTAQYMMASRRLTALPADLDGLQYSLAEHPDMKVEVAVDHQHNVRRRSKEGSMSNEMEFRLMVAVVVIRTLTGGLDKQVDWVLVSKLFPRFPMNAVSKRWQGLYLQHKQMIERLGPDFQDFFLEAYEKGEVDTIDYDHLVDYDWNSLVDLAIERIDINPSKTTTHRLLDSRADFDQMFAINEAEHSKAWRDDYFSSQPPVYKRLEYSASEHNTIPISKVALQNSDIDSFTVAKSWARANTLTPSETYNPEFAARKLVTLSKEIATAATSALFDSKVLMQRNKGRPAPNRGVEITDVFAGALRKHLDATHLTQAAVFKAQLDAQFRTGEVVMVQWTANDGEILAITNLQAHGRIKFELQGVPRNKFGLTGGGYQTKRMDKAILRFDMQILRTPSYIFDADLPILSALTSDFSPPRGPAGAIPVWLDIGENLIPAMWKKVTCVILATIAMRPGVLVKELTRIFSPALEEWEMRVFIEWGVRVGALTVLRDGHEGWTVSEWWWAIGGKAA